MRSKLGKAVRSEFEKGLKSGFPNFERDLGAAAPPGWRIYVWKLKTELWFYITLAISPKDDSFTVEVGWSKEQQRPDNHTFYPDETSDKQSLNFRLSKLKDVRLDYWWYLSRRMTLDDDFFTFEETPIEEALEKVKPAVGEAIREIEELALPYFMKIGESVQAEQK